MTVDSQDRMALVAGLLDGLVDETTLRVLERLESAPSYAESYINSEKAAEHLCCNVNRIHALVEADRIPHHRDGRRLLFKRSELEEYIDADGAHRP